MDKKEIMDKIENKLQGVEFYWSDSPMRKYELIEMYHGLLGKDKNISVEFVGTFQGESFEIDDLEVLMVIIFIRSNVKDTMHTTLWNTQTMTLPTIIQIGLIAKTECIQLIKVKLIG